MQESLLIGRGKTELRLLAAMANRHGLVAGATGTGKTVTLRVMAEGFSRIGVPVFVTDVKGDLAGMSQPGEDEKLRQRAQRLGLVEFQWRAAPVVFWDVLGEQGHPLRATISDLGPLLLSRLLSLNETQRGVLALVFKAADDQGLLLLDLKDLQAVLNHVSEHAREFSSAYGGVSPASIAAIQRRLLELAEQQADRFFGEPALTIGDLLTTDSLGQGIVNILAADKLLRFPKTYATFLLWLLAELFEHLPEVGDLDRPKLAIFFDEAHLLFADAPDLVVSKLIQTIRLIRSKGVGVYFVTQSPLDLPQDVLGQLGNRVQHALRAYTPKDQKSVRAAAQTFRSDGSFSLEQAISELAVGEALVSLLDAQGVPLPAQRAQIVPPQSRLGAISADQRQQVICNSPYFGRYETMVDRQSAYEMLKVRTGAPGDSATQEHARPRNARRQTVVEAVLTSAARSLGSQLGRQIARGLLGSLVHRR
jgi:hypothetical protein